MGDGDHFSGTDRASVRGWWAVLLCVFCLSQVLFLPHFVIFLFIAITIIIIIIIITFYFSSIVKLIKTQNSTHVFYFVFFQTLLPIPQQGKEWASGCAVLSWFLVLNHDSPEVLKQVWALISLHTIIFYALSNYRNKHPPLLLWLLLYRNEVKKPEAIAWTGTWPKTFITPRKKSIGKISSWLQQRQSGDTSVATLSLFALLEIKIKSYYNWMRQSFAESLCTWRPHWLQISHIRSKTHKMSLRIFDLFSYKK